MPPKPDLKQRMTKATGGAAASMIPEAPAPPPPPPRVDDVPDYKDVISEKKDQLTLLRLVREQRELGLKESEIKKARKPLSDRIKGIMGEYEVSKAMCGGLQIAYFSTDRWTLDEQKLLAHGVSPAVLAKSKVKKISYSLKITEPGEKEEE